MEVVEVVEGVVVHAVVHLDYQDQDYQDQDHQDLHKIELVQKSHY